jgi:hypothetical protein
MRHVSILSILFNEQSSILPYHLAAAPRLWAQLTVYLRSQVSSKNFVSQETIASVRAAAKSLHLIDG